MESLTAIQVLLRYLETEGVEYIFGVPGGPLIPLYEALFLRQRIRPILAKHEEGAAFMADGYARVRNGLGVCCATTGPGATNALTGVASSYSDSIPVLLITAQVSTSVFGKGALQESTCYTIDTVDMYKSATKLSAMLTNAEKMPELLQRMLRTAFAGRSGAVHLSIPADLAKQIIPYEIISPEKYRPRSAVQDSEAVKKAAKLLAAANRPGLLVGHGVRLSQADGELMSLAERLGIPVATTLKGKSAFPENHPLSLGVFGFAGHPLAEAYLLSGDVDVLVVVGTSLGEFQTHSWDKRLMPQNALIQIDIDPTEIGKNYPVDVGIVGDAKTVLRSLADTLATQYPETRPVSDRLKTLRSQILRYHQAELLESESTPMKPQAVIAKMQKVLPENTLLFLDNGNCVSWGIYYYEARQPNTIFASLGMAAMGYAIAAAIGGKLAARDRPVVALVGDGAFAMNGMEIHTAAEYNIPVIWIVLNNGGHSMVYHGEKLLFGGELNSSRFRKPIDIWGLAASLGVRSFKAETPAAFEQALQAALVASAPCVIDAVVDFEECPSSIQQRAETLNKFFAGIH